MSSNHLKMLACVCVVAACSNADRVSETVESGKGLPQVYAVNYPLAYFAERIAGESVKVVFQVPPDVDPAFWAPDAETVADYQRADLVLLNGAGYANWIQRASLSPSRLVDTSAKIVDRLIPAIDDVTHTHGPSGDHSHPGTAFTTWLDLEIAIGQAHAVLDVMVLLRPENEADFRERLLALEHDLTELDKGLKDVADKIGDSPLLFSHPVYQYLTRRYELNGYSVHWEPQQLPDEQQWRELSSLLAGHPAARMIWEDEPHQETVSRLEGKGIQSLVFRPCANRPAEGNFLRVMQDNLRALEQAFPVSTSQLRDVE